MSHYLGLPGFTQQFQHCSFINLEEIALWPQKAFSLVLTLIVGSTISDQQSRCSFPPRFATVAWRCWEGVEVEMEGGVEGEKVREGARAGGSEASGLIKMAGWLILLVSKTLSMFHFYTVSHTDYTHTWEVTASQGG
jgi:hypothetical protein